MNARRIWSGLSKAGVASIANPELARKITLCNQIAASIAVVMLVAGLVRWSRADTLSAALILTGSALYSLVVLLNRVKRYTLSRTLLCFLPPVLITFIASASTHNDGYRMALLSVILVPILLFGVTEVRKMLVGIAWVVGVYMGLDVLTAWLPRWGQTAMSEADMALNMQINGLTSFFMFTVCFIYFQRLGRRAEAELSQSLQTVRQQSGIIEEARRTEQLQSQQVIAKMREINTLKSTFVAMTSHEFRTPLATILSSEELLRHYGERLGADERAALFDAIEGAVGRMTDMLDKVLTIGRDDADMLECAPAATDLAALCEVLAGEARTLIAPGIQVSVQLHLDLAAPVLMLDAKLLRFMVGNLLSNAIKYSPEGGNVELRVRYESGTLQIEVRDQGIGIPAQALPQLFDTFHRATNVGNIAGTGLGLSIVQRAARRHGGSVEVHSTLGQGSCFTITLPGVAVAV
ncbi:MAG: hypothetical protein RLZ81_543 [Pseudomonadota bacterium]